MIPFDDVEGALQEAEWCSQTYGTRHCIVALDDGFGVCPVEELEGHERVLEIIGQVSDTYAAHLDD